MKLFNMKTTDLKDTYISGSGPDIAQDENGRLYMKRFREMMAPVHSDTGAIEALAALRYAGRTLHLLQERWAERHGLSEGRLGVLFRLFRCGDMPLGDLADDLESTPRNITGLVDHLERDGLVERVPDPADRRSVRARLTEQGRKQIDAIWKEGMDHQYDLVRGLTKEELAQLRHLCLLMVESARKELGK
jgi:DNA-binding MarR family transcriptional regulator